MSGKHFVIAIVGVCMIAVSAQGAPIVIDGSLADWGVGVGDDNTTVFSIATDIGLLGSLTEDQDDQAGDGGFLGPNQGGQNYDVEMLAVAYQNSHLYIAILTGQRPDNGFQRYAPGDIRIETSGGTYGLEVGGGEGAGAGSPLVAGEAGSTYVVNNHGYTKQYGSTDPLQTAGSIWADGNWLLDPIDPYGPTQLEIDEFSTLAGVADYIYTRDRDTAQHSVIELSFDVGILGGEVIDYVYWSPACGNDELQVPVDAVPEPATLGLMVLSGLGLVRRWAR